MSAVSINSDIRRGSVGHEQGLTFEQAREWMLELASERHAGVIDEREWRAGAQHVLRAFGRRVRTETLEASAPVAATSGLPSDSAQQGTAQRRAWFRHSDTLDGNDVQGHAA